MAKIIPDSALILREGPRELDKTSLSYWFPKIEAAGLPVPKTKIIRISPEAEANIWAAFDGKHGGQDDREFFEQMARAVTDVGLPCFLRTDMTSGKHQWDETCYLKSLADIKRHVFAIAEFSVCADFVGLDWGAWVIRELLPTIPLGVCPRYGNMPVCREFRFFVDDGKVRCWHPYWPKESMEQGGADATLDYEFLCRMDNKKELYALAESAGKAVGGSWSIDILETRIGWYVTDMAEAYKSFHWEDCELFARR